MEFIEPQFDIEVCFGGTVAAVRPEEEFILKFDKEFYGKLFISFEYPVGIGEFSVEVGEFA